MFTQIRSIRNRKGQFTHYAYLIQSVYDKQKKSPRSILNLKKGSFISTTPLKREVLYKLFSETIKCDCGNTNKIIYDNDKKELKCEACLIKEVRHSGENTLNEFEEIEGY